ncbi:Ribose import permease protein RbsC [Pseudomonas syringae pv. actinidiae]|uniref:ABC transporter permease n=1 Tax=Pseudomonas syringae TaxID=317 RepID=UPI000A2605DE|nr:ABC transporter permease [Pseudomonas syringae]OSR68733.1 Ribose import permease protein RbsC [Pseudomonas syringae pv. actinidiae]
MTPNNFLIAYLRRSASFGFGFALIVIFIGFSIAAPNFATIGNVFAMLHAMGPLTVAACGIALVILTGKIDISIGAIAFLSASIPAVLMEQYGLTPWIGLPLIVVLGAAMGAINGFLVAYLKIDSLIATLGTMIAFRGLGLMLTDARVIALPASAQPLGNLSVGPLSVDTLVMIAVLLGVHFVHRRTTFGRHLNAVGNGEEIARKVGINTGSVIFKTFVLSGLLAGASAVFSYLQVGSISGFLGKGLEFNSIAVAVVGGLSLAGGRGRIFPGIVIGALAFQIIANGLNQISASPYVYQLVTGVVIFIAMYLDAGKSARIGRSLLRTSH